MKIRFGYELIYSTFQPTAMVLMLNAMPNASQRLVVPDHMNSDPRMPLLTHRDVFGNTCTRLDVPAGTIRIYTDGVLEDTGQPEAAVWSARETPIGALPPEALMYLLPSRYCESDRSRRRRCGCSVIYCLAGRVFRPSATSSISM